MKDILKREPVVIGQAAGVIANAIFVIVYGHEMNPEALAGIVAVVQVLFGVVARQFVTPAS